MLNENIKSNIDLEKGKNEFFRNIFEGGKFYFKNRLEFE